MIRICTLMDDSPQARRGMISQHGLSFYINTGYTKLLFDFGSDGKFMKNADAMGINLAEVSAAVCSHAHYDHAGGFKDFVRKGGYSGIFITGPNFWQEKYSKSGEKYTYSGCGFHEDFLMENAVRQKICTQAYAIDPVCWVMGNFEVQKTAPNSKRFVKEKLGQFVPDDFSDEICLVLSGENGLTVITGCSHPGILNMLLTISQRIQIPLYSVIGGTHLAQEENREVVRVVSKMRAMGIQLFGFSHCSGNNAEMTAQDLGLKVCHLCSGDIIII